MQENELTKNAVTLSIVTPKGVAFSTECDSVTLPLADGGRIGIRRGHADAEMALSGGAVRALSGGVLLKSVSIEGGYASVRQNVVTVLTDSTQTGEMQESGESA